MAMSLVKKYLHFCISRQENDWVIYWRSIPWSCWCCFEIRLVKLGNFLSLCKNHIFPHLPNRHHGACTSVERWSEKSCDFTNDWVGYSATYCTICAAATLQSHIEAPWCQLLWAFWISIDFCLPLTLKRICWQYYNQVGCLSISLQGIHFHFDSIKHLGCLQKVRCIPFQPKCYRPCHHGPFYSFPCYI